MIEILFSNDRFGFNACAVKKEQKKRTCYPCRSKKGRRNRSKSLGVFAGKYQSPYALRISKKYFGFENNIKSVPLYAVFCIAP